MLIAERSRESKWQLTLLSNLSWATQESRDPELRS
jgi:hypothetical protein